MRETYIDLINALGLALKQSHLTVHLATRYFDRVIQIQSKQRIRKDLPTDISEAQLSTLLFPRFTQECVAVTCLILASKFDELDANIPLVADFAKVFTNSYIGVAKKYKLQKRTVNIKSKTLYSCEPYILNLLEWDLNCATVYSVVQNFAFQGFLFSSDEVLYQGRMRKLEHLETSNLGAILARAQRLVNIIASLASK